MVTMGISLRASVLSTLLTCPLWTLKTRVILHRKASKSTSSYVPIEVLKDTLSSQGVRGLYSGLAPSLILSLYGVVQMVSYETLNWLVGFHSAEHDRNGWIPFFTGGMAKCLSSLFFFPLTTVKVRLQQRQFTHEETK
jgi:hypothetical protein